MQISNATCPHDTFQAKAAKFKELTGREIVIEKNEAGEFIHWLHPDSTQRVGFMKEFFRAEAGIESFSRLYAELREELLDRYSEDEDELYRQMGELNRVFENMLLRKTLSRPDQLQRINTFFETFIKSIQSSDFDTAFAASWK